MVGYPVPRNDPQIGIIADFTNADMNAFVGLMVDTYTTLHRTDSLCGYACSDHASWYKQGFPSAFPFETPFGKHNPNIHSAQDTLSNISVDHAQQFGNLG